MSKHETCNTITKTDCMLRINPITEEVASTFLGILCLSYLIKQGLFGHF